MTVPAAYDNSPRTDRDVQPATASFALSQLARALPRNLRLGTVGWYRPNWRGTVYDSFVGDRPDWFRMYAAYVGHPLFRATEWVLPRQRTTEEKSWQRMALMTPEDFSLFIRFSGRLTDPVLRQRRGAAAGENPEFLSFSLAEKTVLGPIERQFATGVAGVILDLLYDPRRDAYRPAHRKALYERLSAFLSSWREREGAPRLFVNVRAPMLQTPALMKLLAAGGAVPSLTLSATGPSLSAQLRSWSFYETLVPRPGPLVIRWLGSQLPSYFRGKSSGNDVVTSTRLAYAAVATMEAGQSVVFLADEGAEGDAPASVEAFARTVRTRRQALLAQEAERLSALPPELPPLTGGRSTQK